MRRFSKVRLAIAAGLATATFAAAAIAPVTAYAAYGNYSDLSSNHWAVQGGVVDWAEKNDIINGVNGEWLPESQITRAQAAVVLYNLAGNPQVSGVARFDDNDILYRDYSWALNAITWAQRKGIFTGSVNADGSVNFNPGDILTREQAAKILCVISGGSSGNPATLNRFPDRASVSAWATGVVAWAAENDIMGKGGQLSANSSCTRAEFVTMTKSTDHYIHPEVDDWDDDDWDDWFDDDRFDDDDWDDDDWYDDWDDWYEDQFDDDDDDDRWDDDWDDDDRFDDDDDDDRFDDDDDWDDDDDDRLDDDWDDDDRFDDDDDRFDDDDDDDDDRWDD